MDKQYDNNGETVRTPERSSNNAEAFGPRVALSMIRTLIPARRSQP